MQPHITPPPGAPQPPSELPSVEVSPALARKLNRDLVRTLLDGLLKDPEVDLISLIPESYRSQMRTLLATLEFDPKCDLIDVFPPAYAGRRRSLLDSAQGAQTLKIPETEPHFACALERGDDDNSTSLETVFPFSPAVSALLQKAKPLDTPESPLTTLKRLIQGSECIWQNGMGAFVARLNNDIAVKVKGRSQTNHYLALDYLAQHAQGIPAPQPHGLIQLGGLNILFTSYVPQCTLTQAWPSLSPKDKTSIQNQLNDIFLKVRTLPRDDRPLGTLDGHGVIDCRARHSEYRSDKVIHTVLEFEDFIFSPKPCVTDTYVRFLRNLVPATTQDQDCVFTHCDVRPDNIMVDTDDSGDWVITGIIDWEEAGFYPAYWESVKSTRTFLANVETDWYLYQPECMAPSTYAGQWLVDCVWDSVREKVAPLTGKSKMLGQKSSGLN